MQFLMLSLCLGGLPQAPAVPQAPPIPLPAPMPDNKPVVVSWQTDYESALALAAKRNRPVVLFFTQPGCPPCAQLEAGAFVDAGVIARMAKCVCIRVDASTDAGLRTATAFAVTSTPTIIVYGPAGKNLVGVLAGNVSASELLRLLNK